MSGIGQQVALQLAATGVPWLQLIDLDTVEPSNLASQGYLEEDLGKPKVEATGDLCRQVQQNLELLQVNCRFRQSKRSATPSFAAWTRSRSAEPSGTRSRTRPPSLRTAA